MIDWVEEGNRFIVKQVQLADLEDAAHVPPGFNVRGREVGNYMWRGPEAHAQGRVNSPSDMFSFNIVVSSLIHYITLTFQLGTCGLGAVCICRAQASHLRRG